MASPKPIPFVASPGARDTSTLDARFVNVLFEVKKNPAPGEFPVECIKRPGLSTSTQPSGGSAVGRGVYHWAVTGSIYSVFDGDIYLNGTKMTSTAALSTSTVAGRVWFAETPYPMATKLLIGDGEDNYEITSTNVITQIDQVDDAQYPRGNTGCFGVMDGFVFQGQVSTNRLFNTDVNTTSSWADNRFLSVDTYGGELEAHVIQKDQIIVFTKKRVEFYFNNGNPTGSPLLRIDQNTLGFGLASKATLASAGETACFVSEAAADGQGGRSVYLIQSLSKVKEIGEPPYNRLLDAEGLSVSSASAWMERVAGHLVYVINLAAANRSIVYDVDSGLWDEWSAVGGGRFGIVSATSKDGVVYAQHATNGRIYTFQPAVFQDGGANFSTVMQTPRSNFGSPYRKYEDSLDIVGDTTTGNLTVEASDNDGAYATVGTIDMSSQFKRATRLGAFYARSHRFTYADNYAFRVQAWLPGVRMGIG